jgi:hypothetical protein
VALLFAALLSAVSTGEYRRMYLYYFVPVVVPFVMFTCDRIAHWNEFNRFGHLLDFNVIALAALRAGVPMPFVSGHTLFLAYAIMTAQTHLTRIAAVLVMLQVLYLKAIVWNDHTFIGGILLGSIAAASLHRQGRSDVLVPAGRVGARQANYR